MNLILERTDRVEFFTDVHAVFEATGIPASAFDWYLSDVETNYYGTDFSSDDRWISGTELEEFLNAHTVQFIWAVFSAFPIGYRRVITDAPYADGNPNYWKGVDVSPQLSGANFEIVCWDSSSTMLIGLPDDAEKRFTTVYPETRSLAAASQNRHF